MSFNTGQENRLVTGIVQDNDELSNHSGAEESFKEESDDDLHSDDDLEENIARNRAIFRKNLLGEPETDTKEAVFPKFTVYRYPALGPPHNPLPEKTIIKSPTASHIMHGNLHPGLYRNLGNLEGLDGLANRLGVARWTQKAATVLRNKKIQGILTAFTGLDPRCHEDEVEAIFNQLNIHIALLLDRTYHQQQKMKSHSIITAGLLVDEQYAIRGVPDYGYVNEQIPGFVLYSECKTLAAWPDEDAWYQYSKLAQSMMAVFTYLCPVFLYCQNKFKIFMMNKELNSVLTFPYYQTAETLFTQANSTQIMDKDFVRALVICWLATPATSALLKELTPKVSKKKIGKKKKGKKDHGFSPKKSSGSKEPPSKKS